MFYIVSHVVPGLLTFLDGLLTGNFRRNFWFYIKKIILSEDVETNPGPQSKRCQEIHYFYKYWIFSICRNVLFLN